MIAAIALGSNQPSHFGDSEANVREALRRLSELGEEMAVSSFYVTKPVGFVDQPDFVNAAAILHTQLGPLELLRRLLAIEQAIGRDRTNAVPKGPRVIDLDLLLFGELVLNEPELILPHPAMHERRFVLEPLAEIAGTMKHPRLGLTVSNLLKSLP